MAFYVKITKKVADKIGAPVDERNKTADGNILLWQADLDAVQGATIFDRAEFVGGVVLTPSEARNETLEAEGGAEVFVPEYFEDRVQSPNDSQDDIMLIKEEGKA